MKKILCLFILLLAGVTVFAQRNSSRNQIESVKIGLITNRLNITSEQAPQFWATYNEYSDKRASIRKDLRRLRTDHAAADSTDAQALASIKEMMILRQKEVDLEKDYMNKFLKSISPKQLAELYKTEQDFTRLLLRRLETSKREHHSPQD